ncbi:hypothetical protein Hanom_Chr13g01224581 [Helianthus anomalus]
MKVIVIRKLEMIKQYGAQTLQMHLQNVCTLLLADTRCNLVCYCLLILGSLLC